MDDNVLANCNLVLPGNIENKAHVACTQRNKENIKKEIERNTRRKTIDKILRLSQLFKLLWTTKQG